MATRVSSATRSESKAHAPAFSVAEKYAIWGAALIACGAGFLGFYAETIINRPGGEALGLLGVMGLLVFGMPLCMRLARDLPEHGPAVMLAFIAIAGAFGIGVRAVKADEHHHRARLLTATQLPNYLGVDTNACDPVTPFGVPGAAAVTQCPRVAGEVSYTGATSFRSGPSASRRFERYVAGTVTVNRDAKVIADRAWAGGWEVLYTDLSGAHIVWKDTRRHIVASADRPDGDAVALQRWFDQRH
jgi:hypothetical protein